MSLINKMLDDLEKREAFLSNDQDLALDGLCSAYDVESQNKKYFTDNYKFLFLLIVLSMAGVILLLEQYQPSLQLVSLFQGDSENQTTKAEPSLMNKAVMEDPAISLKLDNFIKNDDEVPPVLDSTRIEESIYLVAEEDESVGVLMNLDGEYDYSISTLKNPYRTLIEIDNYEYNGGIPDFSAIDKITSVRKKQNKSGFDLVIESESPMIIKQSLIKPFNEQYQLHVLLQFENVNDEINNAFLTDIENQVEKNSLSITKLANISNDVLVQIIDDARKQYQSGFINQAIVTLYDLIEIDRGHIQGRTLLAKYLIEKQQLDEALNVLNDGLTSKPDQIEWKMLLAKVFIDRNNFNSARRVLLSSSPELSKVPEYYSLLAAIVQQQGQHLEAVNIYRNLLKYNKNNGIWWMGLGISLEALARNEDALYAYKNAIDSESITPETFRYINERITVLTVQVSS